MLGCGVYSEMITDASSKDLNATSLRGDFLSLLERSAAHVIEGWPAHPDTLPKIAGDSVIQSTLQAKDLDECVPFLDIVLSTELKHELGGTMRS